MDGSKNAERRPLGAADEEDPGRHRAPVFEEDEHIYLLRASYFSSSRRQLRSGLGPARTV
jgi:hypothetical protein